jgi:AAA domain
VTLDLEKVLADTDPGPVKDDRYFQPEPPNERYFQQVESVPAEDHRNASNSTTTIGNKRGGGTSEGSLTLPFAPLSSLIEDVPSEPNWVFEGYVSPGTLTLFAGRPKAGKTTFLFGLFAALLNDEDAFVGRKLSPSRVCYLTEERPGTLAEKASRWPGVESVTALTRHQAGTATWPEVVAYAVAYCKRNATGLLVVDTFADWASLTGDTENAAGAVIEQIRPLQDAAARGLAVVAVAHQRKSFGEFGEAIRGSNAIAAAVDVIVELERPVGVADESLRVLKAVSRYSSTPSDLAIALTEEGYEARGDLATAKTAADKAQVEEAIRDLTAPSAKDLAEHTGIPEASCLRHARALVGELDDIHVHDGRPLRFSTTTPIPIGGGGDLPLFGEAA